MHALIVVVKDDSTDNCVHLNNYNDADNWKSWKASSVSCEHIDGKMYPLCMNTSRYPLFISLHSLSGLCLLQNFVSEYILPFPAQPKTSQILNVLQI